MKKYTALNIWWLCWLVGSSWASQSSSTDLKVVMIGETQVGKTAILERFVEDKFVENYKATIGADFRTKDFLLGEKTIMLQIWDTAGQEQFKALAAPFYSGAHAVMFVYDITNKQSLENSQEWLQNFLQHARLGDRKVSLIVCGNKLDLAEKMPQVTKEEVDKFVQSVQQKFSAVTHLKVSAKDGTNIQKLFDTVAREALKQKVLLEEKQKKLDEEFKDDDTNEDDDTDDNVNSNTNIDEDDDTDDKHNNLPNKIKKFFEADTSLCILFLIVIAIAGGWYLFSSTEQATDYLTDFREDVDDEENEKKFSEV